MMESKHIMMVSIAGIIGVTAVVAILRGKNIDVGYDKFLFKTT